MSYYFSFSSNSFTLFRTSADLPFLAGTTSKDFVHVGPTLNSGDLMVIIKDSTLDMDTIIPREDTILLRAHNIRLHMVTIHHSRVQEAITILVGSKGLHIRVIMVSNSKVQIMDTNQLLMPKDHLLNDHLIPKEDIVTTNLAAMVLLRSNMVSHHQLMAPTHNNSPMPSSNLDQHPQLNLMVRLHQLSNNLTLLHHLQDQFSHKHILLLTEPHPLLMGIINLLQPQLRILNKRVPVMVLIHQLSLVMLSNSLLRVLLGMGILRGKWIQLMLRPLLQAMLNQVRLSLHMMLLVRIHSIRSDVFTSVLGFSLMLIMIRFGLIRIVILVEKARFFST